MLIPKEVKSAIDKLKKQGFEAYIVGGCVRDFLCGVEPADWDITTNAKPEEIQKIFPKNFYENKFLTVTVRVGSPDARDSGRGVEDPRWQSHRDKNPKLKEIEITTYRLEAKYSDKRHPDEIRFAKALEEDLARRDFTINALALDCNPKFPISKSQSNPKSPASNASRSDAGRQILNSKFTLIDLFDGQEDLKNKIIRTVGKPEERFSEDALRMLRAIRFATTLNFKIEPQTLEAIKKNAEWLKMISEERIRDEFIKIIMSEKADEGIELLREAGLLKFFIPELLEGYNIGQNKHHIYDCWQHALLSLKYSVQKKFNQNVRLAALFHDIGKPRAKRGDGLDSTFYNHEIIGARMTQVILERLKFPKKDIEKIVKLVRYHLFYYNVDEVKDASVRRLVRNVGSDSMEELLQVRMADRIGSGVPKAEPYKLRHLKYIVDKVGRDPISTKMLKINGNDVMKILNIKPGPKIGQILDVLLGYVLVDPKNNKKEFLKKETLKLGKITDNELKKIADVSQQEKEKIETKQDQMTKQKYWVT